jgi:hypothetical protein
MSFLEAYAPYVTAITALLFGMLLTWLFLRARLDSERVRAEERSRAAEKAIAELEANSARLESEVQHLRHAELKLLKSNSELDTQLQVHDATAREREQLVAAAELRMSQTFKSIAADALRSNQNQFLELARAGLKAQQDEARNEIDRRRDAVQEVILPIGESLRELERRLAALETNRGQAVATLTEQISELAKLERGLQEATDNLIDALEEPEPLPAVDFASHPARPADTEDPDTPDPGTPFEGFTVDEDEDDIPARHPGAMESLKRAAEALNGPGPIQNDAEVDRDFQGFVHDHEEPDPEGAADDLRAALNE